MRSHQFQSQKASQNFHLFEEDGQLKAAKALASLLTPEPGSMIFGWHVAAPERKEFVNPRGEKIYCHSPESWKELWDGEVFTKGTVAVETWERNFDWRRREGVTQIMILQWKVSRL